MSFLVLMLPRAEEDIESAGLHYSRITNKLGHQLIDQLIECIQLLEANPFFALKYKTVRTVRLRQFPYLVHFLLLEGSKKVIILAVIYAGTKPKDYSERL